MTGAVARPRARGARTLAVALACATFAGAAVGCSGDDDAPTNPRSARPAATTEVDTEISTVVGRSDVGAVLTVDVRPPEDATEMQVALDPGFVGVDWQPVGAPVRLGVDGGYQEVMVRFRTAPGTIPSPIVVHGVDVDLEATAATSDPPPPTAIGLATPTKLVVDVEVGRIRRGVEGPGDRLDGVEVDPRRLDDGWALTSAEGAAVKISSTDRATVPTDTGRDGDGDATMFPVRHRVTLHLSSPLTTGEYRLTSPLGTRTTLRFDDRSTRSPAVHANQVGHRPGDRSKRAYLTTTPGTEWPSTPPGFHVVDTANGADVFDGVATLQQTGPDGEVGRGDLTGSDVWALDYSTLTAPGRYRVCVEGVGCSEPWSIDDDTTWMRVATTIARGLYHQRSGTALGQPTSSLGRPRVDHPDDGLVVHQSTLTSLEASQLTDDVLFERLVAGSTDEVVEGAWGGHFDAGDWDRRSQHLWMARLLLDLARVAPDRFAARELNLPESGDDVPDLVDEAMWTVDLFRRLQRPDGAVRGGVESARFPERPTPSWEDDLARFAYAPDPWTSYMYAGVAADASALLEPVDPTRAADLRQSAVAAMTWAEAQEVADDNDAERVGSQRAVAAASLLRLTGDRTWNDVFLAATPFDDGPQSVLGCNANELCDAGWNYLWADPALTDPSVVSHVRESFVLAAARSADAADTTLFGWCLEDPDVPLVWGLGVGGAPHAITLLRAWILTGDDRFRAAAERCASVSLGANPLDVSYVTGLGAHPVRHPLIVDVNTGALPAWAGTPVYGNHRLGDDTQWVVDHRLRPAGATDDAATVPYLLSWYDLADVGPMDEFTVHQSHGPALWVAGVLATDTPTRPTALGAPTSQVAR